MSVEKAVDEVFRLFRDHGDGDYLEEAVSKTKHSIQCGMLAERDGYPREVIVGAFLHDIGHLIGTDQGLPRIMTDGAHLGAKDHDKVGAEFLRNLGFPDLVCDLVGGHVDAKRYLVCKYPEYYEKLTSASKRTLEHQGGRMTADEAACFEASSQFEVILRMRSWDEKAKDPDATTDSIDKFKLLCIDVLKNVK